MLQIKALVLAALATTFGVRTANAQRIYWSDVAVDGIHRADLDGSNIEPIVTGSTWGLALDLVEGKMYWSDIATSSIRRANLDGSDAEHVLADEYGAPGQIALDLLHGKVYWNNGLGVWRANLDGTGIENVLFDAEFPMPGLALDPAGGILYWTYADDSFKAVMKANLDGSNPQQLITEGLWGPRAIALDKPSEQLYFLDGHIRRADTDGANVEIILRLGTNVGVATDLALDVSRSKVYWSDRRIWGVHRANLDGSDPERLPIDLPYEPWHIAIDDRVSGDCDSNGAVETADAGPVIYCLSGPDVHWPIGCACADAEGDADVDLADLAVFQRLFVSE